MAAVRVTDGAAVLKSENARLSGWVYVDVRGDDLTSVVRAQQHAVAQEVWQPTG